MVQTTWDLALAETLMGINARRMARGQDPDDPVERELAERFGTPRRLAVYGSLAPGEVNHHVVAELPGSWREGVVTGTLRLTGSGAAHGFPALRWRAGGPPVPARLFVSEALQEHWGRLDVFEGAEYVRILVPVHDDVGTLLAVANLYADAADA